MLSGRATARILGSLGSLAFCTLAFWHPAYFNWSSSSRAVAAGLGFGTFFSVIAIAAAWMAVGTPSRIARASQSIAACFVAILTVLVNAYPRAPSTELLPLAGALGLVALAQYAFIATALWLVLVRRNVRLCHAAEWPSVVAAPDQQFGIREILVATTATAALLAAIRWLIQLQVQSSQSTFVSGLAIIGFLAACNFFVALPLLVAPLLRRFALVSSLVALAFVAIVTVCEIQATKGFIPDQSAEAHLTLWGINYSQAMWVLLVLGTLRAGGYRLATASPAGHPAVDKA